MLLDCPVGDLWWTCPVAPWVSCPPFLCDVSRLGSGDLASFSLATFLRRVVTTAEPVFVHCSG